VHSIKVPTTKEQPVPVFFVSGNGGNKIYAIPSLHAVVVVTSSAYGKGYGQRRSENILKAILAEKNEPMMRIVVSMTVTITSPIRFTIG